MDRARDSRTSPATGRALVVVSRFNEGVTRRLLDGATRVLHENGYGEAACDVVWVPGAFELPVAVRAGFDAGRYDFAVALGAVIRGETPHFDYVAATTSQALMDLATGFGTPVGFGLLTCDTLAQALARAGGAAGNKGADAAGAAIEAHRVVQGLRQRAAT
jgi:6,7-dimethyl-8-ribityllumazine synthase